MSSRKGKKPIKKESKSDFDDFIIVKKKAKIPPKDLTISQILYNIISSDFVKGLSQDMIKFVAMFLLTSYLRGEPLPLNLFNRAINREVNEASTAVDIATQTGSPLYDDDDPEYRLPVMLNALRTFEERKAPETKININAIEEEIGLEYNQLMEGFTNLPEIPVDPEMRANGLKKKLKGGGQGTRNRPRITEMVRPQNDGYYQFQPNSISDIITEAIDYARLHNIPSNVLKTVLAVLSRAAVFLLIYGILHSVREGSEYLANHYMDYKEMFAHYMEEYKNKKKPKTAKDIADDVEHYKSWAKENIGGARKKRSKILPRQIEHPFEKRAEEEIASDQIKEIEESSWFKRFYRNTIKPTANKIYDAVTSDEAVTAAKITAQILILSLLMYAANEAKGAMYEYIGKPAYDRAMQTYYGMQNPLRNLNEVEGPLVHLGNNRYEGLASISDPNSPNYVEPSFKPSRKRLNEIGHENRELFFKENPKSSMRRYFPLDVRESRSERIKDANKERERIEKVIEERAAEMAEAARLAEAERIAAAARATEAARIAEMAEFDERSNMFREYLLSQDAENAEREAESARNLAKMNEDHERLVTKRLEEERAARARQSIEDAKKAQRRAEKEAKKQRELEEVQAQMERTKQAKREEKKKISGRGLRLKNKFYDFIASEDAKDMAKATAVGLIATVLTILASQGTGSATPKKITTLTPRQIDSDLSYYGIPN